MSEYGEWFECEDCRFQTNSRKYAVTHAFDNDHTVKEADDE